MNPLESMLSQYQGGSSYRQGAAPYDVAPTMPSRDPSIRFASDISSAGPIRTGANLGDSSPNSFFSAVQLPPSNVSAGATSTGSSPFAVGVPNLSPADAARVSGLLSGLVYSFPAGGYIHADHPGGGNYYLGGGGAYPANSGGDPTANALARRAYNLVGSAPTRPLGTAALNSLPGYTPSPGASYNQRLGGHYGGPFGFPGWGT